MTLWLCDPQCGTLRFTTSDSAVHSRCLGDPQSVFLWQRRAIQSEICVSVAAFRNRCLGEPQFVTLWQHLSLKRAMGYAWGEQLTHKVDTEAAKALRQAFPTVEAYTAQKSKLTAGALLSLLASQGIDTDWST